MSDVISTQKEYTLLLSHLCLNFEPLYKVPTRTSAQHQFGNYRNTTVASQIAQLKINQLSMAGEIRDPSDEIKHGDSAQGDKRMNII